MTWVIDRKGITGNQATGMLKLIALVCMMIDHIGAAVYPNHMALRVIGRIAFPLYAWPYPGEQRARQAHRCG